MAQLILDLLRKLCNRSESKQQKIIMRSGYIFLPRADAATLMYSGAYGQNWSSRGSNRRFDGEIIPSTYHLVFKDIEILPSNGPDSRFYGFPLRCLSTVIDI